MNYYDYRTYFQTLITNTESIINLQNSIITGLSIIIFLFVLYFLYTFIRNMIKGG